MNERFIESINAENSHVFDGLFSALSDKPATSVRLNPRKASGQLKILSQDKIDKVPWEPNGFYLENREKFTTDPAFHQGAYYVQDASSMIIGEVIRRINLLESNKPLRVLDSCAAPGGKSTAALSNLPEGSAMIANEFDFSRAEILKENIAKWGYADVMVSRGSTERFKKIRNYFDIVIADVPCSGEGMFRKNPVAREQWTPALVQQCSALQKEIIDDLVGSLAAGGYLIYSTCTFNTLENEKVIEYACEEYGLESVSLRFPKEWNIAPGVNTELNCYRFLPSMLKGEGLFLSVLKKTGELKEHPVKVKKNKTRSAVDEWVPGLVVIKEDDILWGLSPSLYAMYEEIGKKVGNLIACGVEIAVIKGKDVIPSQALAMSTDLNREIFPSVELDHETALEYLRRVNITLSENAPTGYILLTHNSLPLGFVKNLGNRVNNLYPSQWRIRHL